MVSIAVPIVSDPAAWTAATFKSPSDYTITFSDSDREELLSAARRIQRQGRLVPPTKLISSDFALHELGERLRRAFMQVRSGCGFVVLQGLPRAGVSFDQFAAMVWGINAHFGFPLSQNSRGELLTDAVDALELGLHTDVTAMLSLSCWNVPDSGGETALASGVTIHNEIVRRAPHLLQVLYRGFHYHRRGEQGAHQEPVTPFRIPVFAVRNGKISVRWARAGFIAGHHELGMTFSDEELRAIELFDEIGRESGNSVAFQLMPGDMVVMNNYVVMHARRMFQDSAGSERKRRLLRVWLDARSFRSVPQEFNQMGAQNGIPYREGRACSTSH